MPERAHCLTIEIYLLDEPTLADAEKATQAARDALPSNSYIGAAFSGRTCYYPDAERPGGDRGRS